MVPQEVACVTGVIGEEEGKEGRREKLWGKFFSPPPPLPFSEYAGHEGYTGREWPHLPTCFVF